MTTDCKTKNNTGTCTGIPVKNQNIKTAITKPETRQVKLYKTKMVKQSLQTPKHVEVWMALQNLNAKTVTTWRLMPNASFKRSWVVWMKEFWALTLSSACWNLGLGYVSEVLTYLIDVAEHKCMEHLCAIGTMRRWLSINCSGDLIGFRKITSYLSPLQ